MEKIMNHKPMPVFVPSKSHLRRTMASYEHADRAFEIHSWDCAVCSGDKNEWCREGTVLLDRKREAERLHSALLDVWTRHRSDAGVAIDPKTPRFKVAANGFDWEQTNKPDVYDWSRWGFGESWLYPTFGPRRYGAAPATAPTAKTDAPRAADPSSPPKSPRPTSPLRRARTGRTSAKAAK